MNDAGPFLQQARWWRRWATRAVDAFALLGGIKSGTADAILLSGYVGPGSGDGGLQLQSETTLHPPKGAPEPECRGRDGQAPGLARLGLSVTTPTATGALLTATPVAVARPLSC